MNRLQRETLAAHPTPPETPLEALAHVLAIYADEPDEMAVLTATTMIYPAAPWTGLRLGDLRRMLDDHAHELAEKIRAELPERVEKLSGPWAEIRTVSTAQRAADLIDPEATA
ncbi:hypothetical protein ACWCO0_09610 [Streptomyces tubercidicus]